MSRRRHWSLLAVLKMLAMKSAFGRGTVQKSASGFLLFEFVRIDQSLDSQIQFSGGDRWLDNEGIGANVRALLLVAVAYQLREMLSVLLLNLGVLKRSTMPYLRSLEETGLTATVVTSFPPSCTTGVTLVVGCSSGSWRPMSDVVVLKARWSWSIVKPCSGMASALPFWISILRMMASHSW